MYEQGNEELINILLNLGCRFVELTAQPAQIFRSYAVWEKLFSRNHFIETKTIMLICRSLSLSLSLFMFVPKKIDQPHRKWRAEYFNTHPW